MNRRGFTLNGNPILTKKEEEEIISKVEFISLLYFKDFRSSLKSRSLWVTLNQFKENH